MQAGRLRTVLTFQTRGAETTDTFATAQDVWADSFSDRGNLEMIGSREFPTDLKHFTETTARIRMRFRSDINPAKHRVVTTESRFSPAVQIAWTILGIYDQTGRQRELIIEVKEVRGTAANV